MRVGMGTEIRSHNSGEGANALIAIIKIHISFRIELLTSYQVADITRCFRLFSSKIRAEVC